MADVLSGPASLSFRDKTIPASMLSEITVTVSEKERERETLAGTFRRGAGTLDEVMAVATLYPPSMDWLGENILQARYSAGDSTFGGNIIFNSDSCSATADAGAVNIHFECEDTDDNDVYFYNASLRVNFEMNYTSDDDLTVELTFYGNPDDDGNVVRLGTGDLTQASVYDVTTQDTVPAGS